MLMSACVCQCVPVDIKCLSVFNALVGVLMYV